MSLTVEDDSGGCALYSVEKWRYFAYDMELSTNDKQSSSSWITEGLILASVPVFAYLLAFIYEAGSASFYRIPSDFVSPSRTTVLVSFTGILVLIIALLAMVNSTYRLLLEIMVSIESRFKTSYSEDVHKRILRWLAYECFLWLLLSLMRVSSNYMICFMLLLCAVLIYKNILNPIIRRWREQLEKKYFSLQKLETQEKERKRVSELLERSPYVYLQRKVQRLGISSLQFFFGVIYICALFFVCGYGNAAQRVNYTIMESSPEMVILQSDGDRVVAAPLDRKTHTILGEFTMLSLSEMHIPVHTENLGRLRSVSNPRSP